MTKCSNCGRNNHGNAVRCNFCSKVLPIREELLRQKNFSGVKSK